jgi:aminopeptidase
MNTRIRKYIELIVRKGLRLDPGQDAVITASVEIADFVAPVVEECYRQGARKVWIEWTYPPLELIANRHQSPKTLGRLEGWQLRKVAWRRDRLPAMLYLLSDDPDGLRGIDQKKRAAARRATYPRLKPYLDAMENRYQWCIAAVPGKAWAQKVFPGLPPARAVAALWDAILRASRALGDPVANWTEHNRRLKARCAALNARHFDRLVYKGANGTDLTVGLMRESRFLGGSETDLSGREFEPNIPSEEVFTTPDRTRAEGIVFATKPLSYQGELIEDFSVRFHEGRVTEVRARRGEALLREMVAMDEGAARLGECSLIPCDSPIHNTGVLFYETLFDENAACHLALGRGFTNCVEGYEGRTQEEMRAMGVNDSMIHVDFMIGYEGLDIDGVARNGRRTPVFRGGEWADP